jgi:hypothetical protein
MDDMFRHFPPPGLSWDNLITISFSNLTISIVLVLDSGSGASALIGIPYGVLMVRTRYSRHYFMVALALETVTDNYVGFTINTKHDWLCTTFQIRWDHIIGY